jgi:hypothetical protein
MNVSWNMFIAFKQLRKVKFTDLWKQRVQYTVVAYSAEYPKINVGLLDCRYIPTFRKDTLPSSPMPKIEAVCFSETLVTTFKSKRRYNGDQHRHLQPRENLKSYYYVSLSPSPISPLNQF